MEDLLNLTPKERNSIEELRKRLDSDLYNEQLRQDDGMFLRFLRARENDLDAAEDMLRKHLAWRKTTKIDTILTDCTPNEVVVKYFPNSRIGFDKDGALLRYFDFGNADFKGLLKAARPNDIMRTLYTYFEGDIKILKEQSEKLGRPIYQWSYIVNFEGYSFLRATHKPTIEFLMMLFQIYEANYPERLKRSFVINTSIYFFMIWSIIKPLLSGATVRKINIFGKDEWKKEVLGAVDSEVLPMFLGGTRVDPDGNPMCSTFCRHGEDVPEKFFMTKSENRISTQPGARRLVVSRKSKEFLPVNVQKAGSMLEWEFETEDRDIKFGVCYKDDTLRKTKEMVPMQRIDAHLLSEAGMYKCELPGTYLLVFDNNYSWIHRKEIYCKVSVIPPKEEL